MRPYTLDMIRELVKCADDIVYFAESYIKIVHPINGTQSITLNSFQKEVIRNYEEKKIFALHTGRQRGKTTIAAIILLHKAIFNPHERSAIFAPRRDGSNFILDMIEMMHSELPWYFGVSISERYKDILQFDNGADIHSCGGNVQRAKGMALTTVYFDESEFIPDLEYISSCIMPTVASNNKAKTFALTSTFRTKTSKVFGGTRYQ